MSNTITFTNPQPPRDAEPKPKQKRGKVILLSVIGGAVLLTGIGIGAANNGVPTTTTVAAPAPAAPAPACSCSGCTRSGCTRPGTGARSQE